MPSFPKGRTPKAAKAAPPAPTPDMRTAPVTLPNDSPGVEVADTVPVEQEGTSAQALSAADDTVTLSTTALDAMIEARVKAAVDATLKAAPPAPSGTFDEVKLAETVAKTVAMVMAANQNNQANSIHASELARARAREAKLEKCTGCGQALSGCGSPWVKLSDLTAAKFKGREEVLEQYLKLKTDKHGYLLMEGDDARRVEDMAINHVKMVVYPKDDQNAEYFPGLRINGKVYLSNGSGHEIWVPRVNNFAAALSDFETGEKRLRTPRKMVRQFGGSVSGNGGTNTVPIHFT